MNTSITIDKDTIGGLSAECKMELAKCLGLYDEAWAKPLPAQGEESDFAILGVDAARAFLLGCSEKTTAVLGAIVEAGDTFDTSEIAEQMSDHFGALRGVWTGLTKRVRTITGDDEAELIDWFEENADGSWKGCLMPETREAFRAAIAERK